MRLSALEELRVPTSRSIVGLLLVGILTIAGSAPMESVSENRALITAAGSGDTGAIQTLLELGADIDARDGRGRNAVLTALHGAHVDAASLLISRGADVNAQDDARDNAFLFASARGHAGIIRQALDAGANPGATNRFGGTALIPASHLGHVDSVRVLLKSRIDVDHINLFGWTALLEAIILGDGSARYQAIVGMLLDRGADPERPDADGVTPLTHARMREQFRIVDRLVAAGARDASRSEDQARR